VETRLIENGLVIDYLPKRGFVLVPARPGVDMGLVREVDGVLSAADEGAVLPAGSAPELPPTAVNAAPSTQIASFAQVSRS
jgi:hypothetical protein